VRRALAALVANGVAVRRPMGNRGRSLRTILNVCVSLAAIVVAFWLLNWSALVTAVAQLSLLGLASAALFSVLTNVLLAVRWGIIAAPVGQNLLLRDVANVLVGVFFNIITPAGMGADLYRVATGKSTGGRPRTVTLVLIERLIGIAAHGGTYLIALIALPVVPQALGAAAPAFAILFAAPLLLVLIGVFYVGRPHRWAVPVPLAPLRQGLAEISSLRLLATFLISAAALGSWIACIAIIGLDVGLDLHFAELSMIAIATEFARLLPISVQGIGVREGVFAWLCAQSGAMAESGFAACALAYALHFALVALTAGVALAVLRRVYHTT
jgi:glycosyltransferase 2 family protein